MARPRRHGCPYRHFGVDNLVTLLQVTGVHDRDVLKGARDDVEKKRFHIACNRVFEWADKGKIKRVKDDSSCPPSLTPSSNPTPTSSAATC